MNEVINIGVIGCGDIASTRHIPTILACPEAKLMALCDKDIHRAKALAADHQVAFFTSDYKELLKQEDLHAVIVATPPWATPMITMDCLQAGKHVLCEKPMALEVETALQVVEMEKATGKKVQVGFTYRHDPLLEKLKAWIKEGKLGSPLLFRLSVFDETWEPIENPEHYQRIVKTLEHGSPSIHDGAHLADFLHFLTESDVKSIEAFGLKSREEFPASNYDMAGIRFENGDMAKVEIGWFFPKFPQDEFEVLGPNGVAIFDRHKRYVQLQTKLMNETVSHHEEWGKACFKIQLARFLKSIRSNQPCVPGSMDGVYSLRMTKAIEAAIQREQE